MAGKQKRSLKSLDEKLEMDQLLKLFTAFPMEEDLLYEALYEYQKAIEGLRYKDAITLEHYHILFPETKLTDFTKFDYTLLHVLISKFTDISRPNTGWESEPRLEDQSEGACYVRIYLARHMIATIKSPVSYTMFQGILNYARQPLLDLGNECKSINTLNIPQKFDIIAPNHCNVTRKEELDLVNNYLHNNDAIDPRRIVVLHGPNSCGKREIVRMHIKIKGSVYDDNIIWIQSRTSYILQKSLRDLCSHLGLSVTDARGNIQDGVSLMKSVHEYFRNSKVLFVFEGAKTYQQIMELIPTNPLSYIIIISKEKFCVRRFDHVAVGKLSLEVADDLLKKSLPVGDCFQTGSLREYLAKSLRFNPLALSLASSFIQHSGTTTWDFIDAVKTVIRDHMPRQIASKRDRILMSVYAALYMSYNALTDNSLAQFVLNVISYLNGSRVEKTLLVDILKNSEMFLNMTDLDVSLQLLEGLSLIRVIDSKTNKCSIVIHTTVQEANRIYQMENSTSKTQAFHCIMDYVFKFAGYHRQRHFECGKEWMKQLMFIFESKLVHSHFLLKCKQHQQFLYDVFVSKGLCRDLLGILRKLEQITEKHSKDRFAVKIMIAKCHQNLGHLGKAMSEFEDIEYRLTRYFGEDDWQVLETKFLQIFLIYKQKRYANALDLCNELLSQISRFKIEREQLRLGVEYLVLKCNNKCGMSITTLQELETFESVKLKAFQEHHPYVFRVQFDIGKYHQKRGEYPEAISKFKQLELKQIQVYGEMHLDVLKTKQKLAECFIRLRDWGQALPNLAHIKDTHASMHGAEHIITLKSKQNYALCLIETSRHDEAFELLSHIETVQENNQSSYTIEDIIQSKYHIAKCLHLLGFFPQAYYKYEEIKEIQEELYGDTHRDVFQTQHYLADCLHEMGHLEEATMLYRQTEYAQMIFLGENHEDVIRTQHNLSVCFIDSCQEKRAFKELKQLEEKQKAFLSPHHPELLITQTNMAVCLHKRQFYDRALKRYQQVLFIQKQHFGELSPIVMMLKHHIALCLHDQGKHTEALAKYEEIFNTQAVTYGCDHPNTLRTRYNRAICYLDLKKFRKALKELAAVEEMQLEVLGENHPDTQRTQTSLKVCGRDNHVIIGGPASMCSIL